MIQRVRSAETLLRISLWAALVAVVSFTRADPDLWGHVRFGEDILRDLSLPDRDPYSFTSDRPWVNHEWLAEVAAGGCWRVAGPAGLVVLKLGIVCGLLLLVCRMLRDEGIHVPRIRDYLAGIAVITTIQQAHHVRPQIFSLLFFGVLLTCLIEAGRGHTRWLLPIPILFATWANFHGGWIVGGAVLLLWTVGVAMKGPLQAAVAYAVTGAASLIATLANPYGVGMWQFLRETVGFGRADIADWQPIYSLDPSVWLLWIVAAALAAVGCLRAARTRVDPIRVLVVIVLAVASFRVNRLLAFFAIATVFLLGRAIAEATGDRSRTQRSQGRTARVAATALALTMIVLAVAFTAVNLTRIRIDPRFTPGPGAVGFLKTRLGGRLLVWFDWGEYAIWQLAPAFKVSIDGRRETAYSADLQDRHLRFFFDAAGEERLADEISADYVWIPRHLPAGPRLGASGWTPVYTDEQSVIFARGEGNRQPVTQPVPSSSPRWFPGP
jgi:hypothetical protein